jgi:hypothetical protein
LPGAWRGTPRWTYRFPLKVRYGSGSRQVRGSPRPLVGPLVAIIDLIVLPILNIYRKYYGLNMAAFLLVTFRSNRWNRAAGAAPELPADEPLLAVRLRAGAPAPKCSFAHPSAGRSIKLRLPEPLASFAQQFLLLELAQQTAHLADQNISQL